MSGAGFLAHAVLGGVAESTKGIGNKIREEAKLKRQQALDASRAETDKELQAHQSELAAGREQAGRDFTAGENEKRREHDLALADKGHKQQKDLVSFRVKTEMDAATKAAQASGKLTDRQNANLDRINSTTDHLYRMERELTSGRTGDFGEFGVVTPENSGEKLAELRQQIKAQELAFNLTLGNQRGGDGETMLLNRAAGITDPAEQANFLKSLKGSQSYTPALEKSVQEVWGTNTEESPKPAVEPAPKTEPDPQPEASAQPAPSGAGAITEGKAAAQPEPQPSPEPQGMISEATNPNAGKSSASEFVEPYPEKPENPMLKGKPGPAIEKGLRAAGNALAKKAHENVEAAAQELGQIARGEREPHQGNIRAFLTNNPEALKRLPPEDLQRLKARYGDAFINQFLK